MTTVTRLQRPEAESIGVAGGFDLAFGETLVVRLAERLGAQLEHA